MAGALYLVSTPIGNLEDITLRALRILRDEVDLIACEDTRQTQKLLDHYEIRKPLVSYHEHNELARSANLIEQLEAGKNIALVSDAGTPLLSDPGFRLVSAAIRSHVPVIPLPGPSAALAALVASGFPPGEFRFIGFLPYKAAARGRLFEQLRAEPSTLIAFESPHRILESLADAARVLPDRPLVLARELTKLHEELLRGTAPQILSVLAPRAAVKGEITLVFGPPALVADQAGVDALNEVRRLESEGVDRMEAMKIVARQLGLGKRDVYRLLQQG